MEPDGRSARGGRDSPKKVVTNKRDYRSLDREYVISRLSIREICRNHGISAHSSVVVQAKKEAWHEKRHAYQSFDGSPSVTSPLPRSRRRLND
jgi:hypothetical protein